MKKALASIFKIAILLVTLLIIYLVTDVVTDIYPKSKDFHFTQITASRFWEQTGVHKRTCKEIRWFFVAVAYYEPSTILQYYEEKWNDKPNPPHPLLAESEYQGRFFPTFRFIILSKFEFSMRKYLGYTTQSVSQKEYTIGKYLYICKLEDLYK